MVDEKIFNVSVSKVQLSTEQLKLYQSLLEIGPGPAAHYLDACSIMANYEGLSSSSHLVAHLLREIDSALINLFDPRLDQANEVDNGNQELAKALQCVAHFFGEIYSTLIKLFDPTLNHFKEVEEEDNDLAGALQYLDISKDDPLNKEWHAIRKRRIGLAARAHRNNLESARPLDKEFQELFDRCTRVFTAALMLHRTKYLKIKEYIDSIITLPNPPSNIRARIPFTPLAHGYLFNRLSNPSWLQPLTQKGFFSNPPSEIINKEDNTVFAPGWPQTQYLKLLAETGTEEQKEAILQIMLSAGRVTNYRVHLELTEIAMLLPPSKAATWALYEAHQIAAGQSLYGFLEMDLAKLVTFLAQKGHTEPALTLAQELLAIAPDPKATEKISKAGQHGYLDLKPAIRCAEYHYEQILKENIPDLYRTTPEKTISYLCSLLEKWLELSSRGEKPNDHTCAIRPAIEEHSQNHQHENIICSIIITVRDAFKHVCDTSPEELSKIITLLKQKEWAVFQRIGMYLLQEQNNPPCALLEQMLVNEEHFNSSYVHHEYFTLSEKHFGKISQIGQETILSWIAKADTEKQNLEKYHSEWTEQQKEERIRHWQYGKLIPLSEYLAEDMKRHFSELESEFGKKSHAGFTIWMTGMLTGPTSPLPRQELAEMPTADIVSFLATWQAPTQTWSIDDGMMPTPEGLARELAEVVAANPLKYENLIEQFMTTTLQPTYVRHLIEGYRQAAEKQQEIPIDKLLKLAAWIIAQPEVPQSDALEQKRMNLEQDLDWHYSKKSITNLIERMLRKDIKLGIEHREALWHIIEHLANDPEPDKAYEKKHQSGGWDIHTLSINTIRGQALIDALSYAGWINNSLVASHDRKASIEDLPEVFALLDQHLDYEKYPFAHTETDHSVFGLFMPLLIHIAPDWTKDNIERIFPAEPEKRELRLAAWSTYLSWAHTNIGVYQYLQHIYAEEVEQLAGKTLTKTSMNPPDQRLVEHIIAIYALGQCSLEDDSIIATFYSVADASFTNYAMNYIGRTIKGSLSEEQMVDRLKALWEWRIDKMGGIAQMPAEELSDFGFWFASGRCGEPWTFKHLEAILKLRGIGETSDFVFNHMPDTIQKYPFETLRCLQMIIEWKDARWGIYPRPEAGVWRTLEKALQHQQSSVRAEAEKIINILCSQGHHKYEELLKTNPHNQN